MVMEAKKRTYQKHKTERKIAVVHKFHKSTKKGERYGQLYVEVRVKNQNTLFKSRLLLSLTKEDFDELMYKRVDANFIDLINYEKTVIEKTIRQHDLEDDSFDLKTWYRSYSLNIGIDIQNLIFSTIGENIKYELNNNFNTDGNEVCLFDMDTQSAGVYAIKRILKFLSNPNFNFKFAQVLLSKYDILFDNFHKYSAILVEDEFFIFCKLDINEDFYRNRLKKAIAKVTPNDTYVYDLIIELLRGN